MRDADEGSLRAQPADRFLRGETRRYLGLNKCCQHLPMGGHDLLTDNDALGIQLPGGQGASDAVVIRYDDAVDVFAPAALHELSGCYKAIL